MVAKRFAEICKDSLSKSPVVKTINTQVYIGGSSVYVTFRINDLLDLNAVLDIYRQHDEYYISTVLFHFVDIETGKNLGGVGTIVFTIPNDEITMAGAFNKNVVSAFNERIMEVAEQIKKQYLGWVKMFKATHSMMTGSTMFNTTLKRINGSYYNYKMVSRLQLSPVRGFDD